MTGDGRLRGPVAPVPTAAGVPERSEWLVTLFRWYVRRYMARHFHAVRISRAGAPPPVPSGPLVVVLNHPSWWDPLFGLWLSGFFPDRTHHAPMDLEALTRYRFLGRLGFFGVERGSTRGASAFLRTAGAIASRPDAAIWITAQGKFTDPRERPARLMRGVGHLVQRLDVGSVLPLALEYPFWDERGPEALARFGDVIPVGRSGSPADWTARIEHALEVTQDALADQACRREPERFETLASGRVGVGGVYDGWRRLRAALLGERFRPEHGTPPRTGPS